MFRFLRSKRKLSASSVWMLKTRKLKSKLSKRVVKVDKVEEGKVYFHLLMNDEATPKKPLDVKKFKFLYLYLYHD